MAYNVITPTKLGQSAIAITNTTVYTVPSSTRALLKDMDIANTTAASITVTVFAGTGVATSNTLIPNVSIPAYSLFQWTGTQILDAADTIVAIASATGVTITVSGGQAV